MRGDESLTEADAAIAGGNFAVEVNFKVLFTQSIQHKLKKQTILETAAAQADAVQSAFFADFYGEVREREGQSMVETAAHVGNADLLADIGDQPIEQRTSADLPGCAFLH